jgi:NADH-quinone oxidoreductase subunit E
MQEVFSPTIDAAIDRIRERYPTTEAALVPVLLLVQRELGSLPENVLARVAAKLGVQPTLVVSTATFYSMFHRSPRGKFHLQVCRNVACFLNGSDALVRRIRDRLALEPGGTTGDGRFSLSLVECLAACGTGPVVQVNDTYHEHMTVETLDGLLDELAGER